MSFRKYKYDVSFSFAEEDDAFVREVAACLEHRNSSYYYYKNDLILSWGRDLEEYISPIYKRHSRLCVVFVSASYSEKIWTQFELKHITERAKQTLQEYLLPFKLDDTELPEISSSVKHFSIKEMGAEGLADAICKKIDVHERQDTFRSWLRNRSRHYFTSPRHLTVFALIAVLIGWIPVRDRLTSVDQLAARLYERAIERVKGSRCGDGSFSESRGSGSCSHHGGAVGKADTLIPRKTMDDCREMAKDLSWVGE